MALILLCLAAALIHAQEDDDEDVDVFGDKPKEWIRGTVEGILFQTKEDGDCKAFQVQQDDTVMIQHAGFVEASHQQFDSNGDAPFKVKIGGGTVITGMEEGMKGMCKGETRLFRFAPHVAFDDPAKSFSRKPVKPGTAVLYQITVVDMMRPHTFPWYQEVALKQVGIPGLIGLLVGLWILYEAYKSYKKSQKRGKKKAK